MPVCNQCLHRLCGDTVRTDFARLQEEGRMNTGCTKCIRNVFQRRLIEIREGKENDIRGQPHIAFLLRQQKFVEFAQSHHSLSGGLEEGKMLHESIRIAHFNSAGAEDGEGKLRLPHNECREERTQILRRHKAFFSFECEARPFVMNRERLHDLIGEEFPQFLPLNRRTCSNIQKSEIHVVLPFIFFLELGECLLSCHLSNVSDIHEPLPAIHQFHLCPGSIREGEELHLIPFGELLHFFRLHRRRCPHIHERIRDAEHILCGGTHAHGPERRKLLGLRDVQYHGLCPRELFLHFHNKSSRTRLLILDGINTGADFLHFLCSEGELIKFLPWRARACREEQEEGREEEEEASDHHEQEKVESVYPTNRIPNEATRRKTITGRCMGRKGKEMGKEKNRKKLHAVGNAEGEEGCPGLQRVCSEFGERETEFLRCLR